MSEHIWEASVTQGKRAGDKDVSRATSGFTLVELLVVIGIIALLISILLPALAKVREQANIVKCLSNVTQLDLAAIMFANEHHGFVPIASDDSWAKANDPTFQKWAYRAQTTNAKGLAMPGSTITVFDWASALIPYLGGHVGQSFVTAPADLSKVFRCPADQWMNVANGTGSLTSQVGGPGYTMINNVDNGSSAYLTPAYQAVSYGYNYDVACVIDPSNGDGVSGPGDNLIGVVGGSQPASPGTYGNVHIGQPLQCKLVRVYQPQATILFGDCGTRPRNWNGQQHNNLNANDALAYTSNYNWPGEGGTTTTIADAGNLYGSSLCPWLALRIPTTRHGGKLNFAFCDGHGETITTADWHRVRISPYNWTP